MRSKSCSVTLQHVTFRASTKARKLATSVSSLSRGETLPGASSVWTKDFLSVPVLPPTSNKNYRNIQIKYTLSVNDPSTAYMNVRTSGSTICCEQQGCVRTLEYAWGLRWANGLWHVKTRIYVYLRPCLSVSICVCLCFCLWVHLCVYNYIGL